MFDDEEDLFICDDHNIDHIARHSVLPEEAEEAFWDEDRISAEADEKRFYNKRRSSR